MTVPSFYLDDLQLDAAPYMVARGSETLDLSVPETTITVLDSLTIDGDIVMAGRSGNRTLKVPMVVEAGDLGLHSDAELTLIRTANTASSFTVEPGGFAEPTVFDVFVATAQVVRDDDYEAAGLRRWDLTLVCGPWSRPRDKVTFSFTASAGSIANLDTCTSATNFAAVGGSAALTTATYPSVGGDASVVSTATITTAQVDAAYDWTGTVGGSSTYLALDYTSDQPGFCQPRMSTGGSGYDTASDAVAIVGPSPLNANYTRYVFANPGGTPRIHLRLGTSPLGFKGVTSGTAKGYLANLGKGSGLPASSMYVVDVPGAMRTTAAVKVTATSGTLSALACYWDPTMLSFGWSPNDQASWANAPAARYLAFIVNPGASVGYQLALTYTDAAGVVATKKTLYQGGSVDPCLGVPIGIFDFSHSRTGVIGAGGAWTATKTGVPSGGSSSVTTTANLVLLRMSDEVDPLGHSDYISVNPRSGDTICWLDDPTVTQPFGTVSTGTSTYSRDASDRVARAGGSVTLTPGTTAVWVPVIDPFTAPTNLSVEGEYFPRFHSYVSSAS